MFLFKEETCCWYDAGIFKRLFCCIVNMFLCLRCAGSWLIKKHTLVPHIPLLRIPEYAVPVKACPTSLKQTGMAANSSTEASASTRLSLSNESNVYNGV